MLKIDRLTKNYGSLTALDQVSLEIAEGLTGLLGPNGAVQSTLLKVVLGMLQPSAGTPRLLGYQVCPAAVHLRAFLAYRPEPDTLPQGTPGCERETSAPPPRHRPPGYSARSTRPQPPTA